MLLTAGCFFDNSSAAWIGLQNIWPLFLTIFCFIAVRWLHSFTNLRIWQRMYCQQQNRHYTALFNCSGRVLWIDTLGAGWTQLVWLEMAPSCHFSYKLQTPLTPAEERRQLWHWLQEWLCYLCWSRRERIRPETAVTNVATGEEFLDKASGKHLCQWDSADGKNRHGKGVFSCQQSSSWHSWSLRDRQFTPVISTVFITGFMDLSSNRLVHV